MPLYEYRCEDGHVTELVRPVSATSQRCPCGRTAQRRSVYRLAVVQPEVTFNGRDFIEASAAIEDQRSRLEQQEGVPVNSPDFYREALKVLD